MTSSASWSLQLPDAEATAALGAALVATLPSGLVWLSGPLGAGKTTLVRGALRALDVQGPVRSPTYTLVEPYVSGERRLYHFDLYRLGDPVELEEMGVRDYFEDDALLIVEWPERGAGLLPAPRLELVLAHPPLDQAEAGGDEGRLARVQGDIGLVDALREAFEASR